MRRRRCFLLECYFCSGSDNDVPLLNYKEAALRFPLATVLVRGQVQWAPGRRESGETYIEKYPEVSSFIGILLKQFLHRFTGGIL